MVDIAAKLSVKNTAMLCMVTPYSTPQVSQ